MSPDFPELDNPELRGRIHRVPTVESVLHFTGLALFVVIAFLPVVSLLMVTIRAVSEGNTDLSGLMVPSGRRLGLFAASLLLAFGVSISGMIFGVLGALFLWRFQKGAGYYLRWLVILLVAVPPYAHAVSWADFLGFIGLAMPSGWIGAWSVLLMTMIPVEVGLILIGFEAIDPKLIEYARLMRTDFKALVRVILPLAGPAILAAGGFAFVLSLTDYAVPALYQVNVYPFEIFADFSASGEPSRAFMLSIPLLLVTVIVLAVSQSAYRSAAMRPSRSHGAWASPPRWYEPFQTVLWLAGLMLALQLLVPLTGLIAQTESFGNLARAADSASNEIFFSLKISAIAAMLAIPVAVAVGIALNRTGSRRSPWWLIALIPLAIPAPLIGIGLIATWNQPMFSEIYLSWAMPVMALLTRFVPIAAFVILTQLKRIDPMLIDAARIMGRNRILTWTKIYVPMAGPGLIAAACIVFALSVGELGATMLVTPPGHSTLMVRIFNYLHYGSSENVASLILVMLGIILLAAVVAVVSFIISGQRLARAGMDGGRE